LNRLKALHGVHTRDKSGPPLADAIASSGMASATSAIGGALPNPTTVTAAKVESAAETTANETPMVNNPNTMLSLFGIPKSYDGIDTPSIEEQEKKNLIWTPYNLHGTVKDTSAARPNYFCVTQIPSGVDPDDLIPKITKEGKVYSLKCPIPGCLIDPKVLVLALDDDDGVDKKVKVKESMEEEIKKKSGGVRKQLRQEFTLDLEKKCDFDFVHTQPIEYNGTMFLYVQMQAVRTDEWNVKNKVSKIKRFGGTDGGMPNKRASV